MKNTAFLKRNGVSIAVLTFLGVFSFAVVIFLQQLYSEKISIMQDELIGLLETSLGYQIEYEEISPSFLLRLGFRGLHFYVEESSNTKSVLYLERLGIHYNIWRVLLGDLGRAITRITIEDSQLKFDPRSELEVISFVKRITELFDTSSSMSEVAGGGDSTARSPNILSGVSISGRNIALSYRDNWGRATVTNCNFTSLPMNEPTGGYSINLRGFGSLDGGAAKLGKWQGEIFLSGSVGELLEWGESRLILKSVKSDMLEFQKLSLHVQYRNGVITLRKVQDRVPLDLEASLDFATSRVTVQFDSEDFIPSNYVKVGEAFGRLELLSTLAISGSANATLALNSMEVDYGGDVRLAIPKNQYIPIPVVVELVAIGAGPRVEVSKLEINSHRGRLGFKGSTDFSRPLPFPEGEVRLDQLDLPGGKLSGLVRLFNRDGEYRIVASPLRYRNIHIQQITAKISGEIEDMDFLVAARYDKVEWDNFFRISGSLSTKPFPFLFCEIVADQFPVGALLDRYFSGATGRARYSRNEVLATRLVFSSDFNRISYSTTDLRIGHVSGSEEYLTGSLQGNSEELNLRRVEGGVGGVKFLLDGGVMFKPDSSWQYQFQLGFKEKVYPFSGTYLPGSYANLKDDGSFDLLISLSRGEIRYELVLSQLAIPIGASENRMSGRIDGSYTPQRGVYLVTQGLKLEGFPTTNGNQAGSLAFDLEVVPGLFKFDQIYYYDGVSPLLGSGEFKYSNEFDQITASARLATANTLEQHSLKMTYQDGTLDGEIDLIGLQSNRIWSDELTGQIDATLGFSGLPNNLNYDIVFNLDNGSYNGTPIGVFSRVRLDGLIVEVEELSAYYLSQNFLMLGERFDLGSGELKGESQFKGILRGDPIESRIRFFTEFDKLESQQELRSIASRRFTGFLAVEEIENDGAPVEPWELVFSRIESEFLLHGGPEDSISLRVNGGGRFDLSITRAMPISLTADGTISGSTIYANCRDVWFDFNALNGIVNIPNFVITEGVARGDLVISGLINDPDVFGDLLLTDIVAEINPMTESLRMNYGNIMINQKVISLDSTVVHSLQGGAAIVSCEFVLDHLIILQYDIYVESIYSREPYLSFNFPKLSAEGNVDGIVRIFGDSNSIHITGDINVSSGTATIDPLDEIAVANQETEVVIELDITLLQNNQFLWPTKEFPVLKAYSEGGAELHLSSSTIDGSFYLLGDVMLKGGEIFYFRKNFYIEEGTIRFTETEDRFDPLLNARAVLREVDSTGDLIKIYLIAENVSFKQFNPRFESDPYRTRSDIFAMLGANLVDPGDDGALLGDALLVSTDLISQFGFFQGIEDGFRNFLGLDVFSLRTQLLPNLIRYRFLNRGSSSFDEEDFSRYLDDTTMFIGKHFGSNFYLEGMVRMDYYSSEYSIGQYYPEFYVDTQVTLEWKSPLAMVELNLYPNFFDRRRDWFNASLGLSWEFSF